MRWKSSIPLILFLLAPAIRSQALTLPVTNTADGGAGSLRQTLLQANIANGPDTIVFAIPGNGPHTIRPQSPLPTLTGPVTIDGYTQGSNTATTADDAAENTNPTDQPTNADLRIELDGSMAGPNTSGLVFTAGSSVVRGLVINRFASTGIELQVEGGNRVEGCFIGTDVDGALALGNGFDAVAILDSPNNIVGGPSPAARNILSANARGVGVFNDDSTGNRIQGNLIGVDRTGATDLGNDFFGVFLSFASDNIVGGTTESVRNVISGNGARGVNLNRAFRNRVQGNYIGTDLTGMAEIGNATNGVRILNATENVIGGEMFVSGNLISGNTFDGILIEGESSARNSVQGNLIGTDADGIGALPNHDDGIEILMASKNLIGGATPEARNIISGNTADGVDIGDNAFENRIQGNYVGTDISGLEPLGNGEKGIELDDCRANIVGGSTPEVRNILSGNAEHGIGLQRGAVRNIVQGNFIGTDVTGLAALPNLDDGVLVFAAVDNLIGGTEDVDLGPGCSGACNLISGNVQEGVVMGDPECTGNRILGNHIGTDVTGVDPIPNGLNGVLAFQGAFDNQIGGVEPDEGNTIAFNGGDGVDIQPDAGTGNSILSNSIFSNGVLGIDLGEPGVTPNDVPPVSNPPDRDMGGNGIQNFPDLILSPPKGQTTGIEGVLTSVPNTDFRIEFFANAECDPSGFGEGARFLDAAEVSTDGLGNADIAMTDLVGLTEGEFVTATATVIDGPDDYGDTSEFSECLEIGAGCVPPFPDFADNGRADSEDLLLLLGGILNSDPIYDLTCDGQTTGGDLLRFSLEWYEPEPVK